VRTNPSVGCAPTVAVETKDLDSFRETATAKEIGELSAIVRVFAREFSVILDVIQCQESEVILAATGAVH